jgi:hypothetical protein
LSFNRFTYFLGHATTEIIPEQQEKKVITQAVFTYVI